MRKYLLICLAIFGLLIFCQSVLAADWQSQLVESEAGSVNALAIDQNNNIHISYFDVANSNLRYATNSSGSWVAVAVDNSVNVGNSAIAIDSNDKVHIIYVELDNDYLKYATNASGSWTFSNVDTSGNIDGGQVSMVIDSDNKLYVSYYDSNSGDLKYATNYSGTWVAETLDSTNNVGACSSLVLDSNNKIHIAYQDSTDTNLKYITNTTGIWVASILDSSGSVGRHPSIDVDNNNKIHISYLDATNNDLKYITDASGSWVASIVDNSESTLLGYYSSLKVDNNNYVHIMYHDATNGILKSATNFSNSWQISNQQTTGSYGLLIFFEIFGAYYRPISMGIDSMNKTHIVYFNYDSEAVTSSMSYSYTPGPSDQTTTINNGRSYSAKKKIHVTSSLTGSPTEMIVSTKSDFSDKTWETYATDKTFEMSSELGKKTIYVKYRDIWHAESDVISTEVKYTGSPIKFVTTKAKSKSEKRITEKNKNYYARDLYLKFKKYPKSFKKTRRYMKIDRKLEYPSTYMDAKNNLLKKYWKIKTDFTKYKSSDKTKLKLVFQYSDSQFDKLKKKVKNLKEKNLYLKYYVSESDSWADLQVKPNTTDNTFTIYLNSPFNYSERIYAIGR